jgi:hypothetical protein
MPSRGTRDDQSLPASAVDLLLADSLVVEEKLDGANVSLWYDNQSVKAALRSGATSMDRAGQLGTLRAWAAQHSDHLIGLLSHGGVLYGEWLYVGHTTLYDRLPSFFVGIDFLEADEFACVDERNDCLAIASIAAPPELFRGRVGDVDHLDSLLGLSRFGSEPMEGLIIRSSSKPGPPLAKLMRPGFVRIPDASWSRGRPHNKLADSAAQWR